MIEYEWTAKDMKTRIAKKIKLAMHYGTERKKLLKESYYFRQPYTIAQQRKAMKVLGLTKYIEFYAGISLKR